MNWWCVNAACIRFVIGIMMNTGIDGGVTECEYSQKVLNDFSLKE